MRSILPPWPSLHEPAEEPIRSELFGIERLEQHGASLAASQRVSDKSRSGRPLLARVEDNGRVLREASRAIGEAVQDERWITPAAEWLLDNFYVVDEQLREIRDDLPTGFYRELPKLADEPFAGFPRVYGIAWAFVAHTDSRFDPEMLRRFVRAYQRVQPLTIGELWAVAITLRVVLVENLRRIADSIVRGRAARQEADALADDLLGLREGGASPAARALQRYEDAPLVTAFAVELAQRLRDQDPAITPALAWLNQRLAAQGTNADAIALLEHHQQAATTVTVRNIITSMRLMSAFDWSEFFESVSLVDEALRGGSKFSEMDFTSRDQYRHAIEEIARGSGRSEVNVADEALRHAAEVAGAPRGAELGRDARWSDPGYYLVGNGRRTFERALGFKPSMELRVRRVVVDCATPGYILTIFALTLVLLAIPVLASLHAGVSVTGLIILGVLAAVPASDFAVAIVNRGVAAIVPPKVPPRLELLDGVPADCRTMVVVPTLLRERAEVEDQVDRLEVHYLANADGDVYFALLSDWVDAPAEHMPGDDEILDAARAGIARLNARHGPAPDGSDRFMLYHRRRVWNKIDGVWMGWERKRGKLHELNRLLRGATDTTFLPFGNVPPLVPHDIRFVVTLDADTLLPIGTVKRLVGTMAHPLNKPRFDHATRHVVEGYGVLQPRVTPPLPGRLGSIFQQLSAGPSGVDPYAAAVSDVYQDLYGEGSYTGKGIYDVDAFETALEGRVRENALLSHDLFESLFARACLVTDVELFEIAPADYLQAAARLHRWARGDWQLLPWILRERVTVIERWKMLDNLRRTLSMPAAFLVLTAGWAWPESPPALWTVFILSTFAVPALFPAFAGVVPRTRGVSKRSHVRAVARDISFAARQVVLTFTMIAHQAWLMTDAIVRTLVRLCITHRKMLEWVPSGHMASRVPSDLAGAYRRMAGGVVLAIASAYVVGRFHPIALAGAMPLIALWILSPPIARWVSRPGLAANVAPLTNDDARELRLIARRTWRFFTTFVGADSHSLPPDNFQETPHPVVAQRTSPTNIGLYLLSAVAARDFGWAGTTEFAERVDATLHAVERLEHFRGHLYNWYETRSGHSLEPRYVSSVDSGNFAASLLTIGSACRELLDKPLSPYAALDGIGDAAGLLRDAAMADPRRADSAECKRLDEALDVVMAVLARPHRTPADWSARLAELGSAALTAANCARDLAGDDVDSARSPLMIWSEELRAAIETHERDLDALLPWAALRPGEVSAETQELLSSWPSLSETPRRCEAAMRDLSARRAALAGGGDGTAAAALRSIDQLVTALERSAAASDALAVRLADLAGRARAEFDDMEFGFLFDQTRLLFSIGYRVAEGNLDSGRYDLLASEARLMSFIAIAKGDVPVKHWFRLGRSLTPIGKDSVLLSWSGSMFEYLMPGLMMRSPVGSLIEQSCRLVVRDQISYGTERSVPWGVSESGYNTRDLEMTYQYSNFGVPGLGLRRGLSDDTVIAPYATALAAMVDPVDAARNFRALKAAGGSGHYGYYESIDYTPSRLPAGTDSAVVKMYMAHHQGMSIVAIANTLLSGLIRARFHAEPIVRASELLLQERTPRDVAVARPRVDVVAATGDIREIVPPHSRRFYSPHGATPRTHLLSNGSYAVMITAAGSGYSHWRDLGVTRWREDTTCDDTGSYIFLRDALTGERWSAGFQPAGAEPESYEVSFSEDRAEFVRRDGAIGTRLEVIVSSEDDAEVRRVSLTNFGSRTREIEVTSYAEVVLAPPAADAAHPAFSNLFVQTEIVTERDTLLASRRPRSEGEQQPWLAHVLAVEGETVGELEWETDRAHFVGRGRTVRAPAASIAGSVLSNTVGSVLDPIVSLRRRIRLSPGKTVRVAFSTLVAASRAEALDLADKYHDVTTFERAATLAWTQAQVQLHHFGITADEAHLFQTLAGSILYTDRALRSSPEVLQRQSGGSASLWAHGISGDIPIVLVEIDEADDVGIVRQLLRAHEYWRMKQLAVDLVILNDRAPSYVQDLQALLETLVRTSQAGARREGPVLGGVFILRADRVNGAQRDTLEAVARVALSSRRGTLAAQVGRTHRADSTSLPPVRRSTAINAIETIPAPKPEVEFFNGLGGFGSDGAEYVVVLGQGQSTPAPWINVIANENFGFIVSETGSSCTWNVNSQENRLTEWANDPVSDPPGEVFYLRDDETGELWSPTALPIREEGSTYIARHGHGYSRFEHESHGVAVELLQFVPGDDPVKTSRLTIRNTSDRARRLTVTGYVEWVLGVSRSASAPFIITEIDATTGAIFARNSWSRDFAGMIAFADFGGKQAAWTADRTEFLGRNGSVDYPAALARREKLSGRVGAALDPCCALQTMIELGEGATATLTFTLGEARSREEARVLIARHRAANIDEQLASVMDSWDGVLDKVRVRTPERQMDLLMNRWLLYQTLACRLWARTAFYQSSGAYGFRDQLQDVMALALSRRDLARAQILKAASRQFLEGDVQHWWHEPAGRGVRTKISDDLLWLPYVTKRYLEVSGDTALLDAAVPFIEGPILAAGQLESYFEPRVSGQQAPLYEHCVRALDRSLAVGAHGLPLMGSGDWNDGMNRVGAGGKGESVWLAWFLYVNLVEWAEIARSRGDTAHGDSWSTRAAALKQAVAGDAWDGGWYRRAYFDDGTPLGSHVNDECQIDSIAQSWSVLSGAGEPDRMRAAMDAVDQRLVRRADSLLLLLAPPFDKTKLEPGYIKGYLPGVRENGGQYTHGAVWVIAAFAALGDGDRAGELFSMINPIRLGSTPRGVEQYKVEPYVISGDVYSEAPHVGRGGWTWYTGAAGWTYRAGLEWILGFRVHAEDFVIDPCIPAKWSGFSIVYRHRSSRYEIVVTNPAHVQRGVKTLELDGVAILEGGKVPLKDDNAVHRVRVVMG